MTVTNELGVEHRRAPGMPGRGGRRMRRAHDPSRLRSRGLRFRGEAQQQRGDAGRLRRQREFAARDQIELPRGPPDFQHHGTERIAGQRIGGTAQRALGIGRAHQHQTTRIEAKLGQPVHRQRAGFNLGKILPYPDQRPAHGDASGKAGNKTGCRRTLMSFGKHLMHRSLRKAAAQHRIRLGMTERHALERLHIAMRLDAFDVAA